MVQVRSLRNVSSRELLLYIPQVENPSLSVSFEDEYDRKEKFMTTRAREEVRGQGEQGETAFESIKPFLFATLMARRQEAGEGIAHPLLLAALMSRRQEAGEGIAHPLLLAALASRRQEGGEGISPIVLAALASRRQEGGEGISPIVLAALASRRQEGGEGVVHPLLLA